MVHKTRSSEVKHTFNNKEAAIYQHSSQRAASFNCNNLRAVNSSHLIVKNLKIHYLCQAIIRATYNSGPFSIPCYGKSKVLRVKISKKRRKSFNKVQQNEFAVPCILHT